MSSRLPESGLLSFNHWPILIILAAAGGLLAAYPPSIFECDAVINSSNALSGETLFAGSSHHPGYSFVAYLASALARRLNPPLNPIWVLQYVSAVAGIAGAYVFYRILLDLCGRPLRAALASGTLLFTYAYWHYAGQADCHIVAALLLLVFLWSFRRFLRSATLTRGIVSGLILGASTLMHITNVLLIPAVILSLACLRKTERPLLRTLTGFFIAFLLISGLPIAVVAAAHAKVGSIGEMWDWFYGSGAWGTWGRWGLRTFATTAVGIGRSVIGSHYLLRIAPIRSWATQLFPAASLEDELALSAVIPSRLSYLLVAVHAAILMIASTAAVRGILSLPRLIRSKCPIVVFLLVWIVVYGAFFAWWAPERTEFWIAWFIPVLAVLALSRPGPRAQPRGLRIPLAFVWLGGLIFVNFFGSIRAQSGLLTEVDTDAGLAVAAAITPGDVVISDCSFQGRASQYLRVFQKVNLCNCGVEGLRVEGPQTLYRHGRYAQSRPPKTIFLADSCRIDSSMVTKLRPRVVRLMDSVITEAEFNHNVVYLIAEPLSADPAVASTYRSLVEVIAEHYDISGSVPVRYDLDLRTVGRR